MALPVASNVYAIWGSSGNNVFAVTSGGHVLRYNGSSWSIATSVSDPLWAVYGVSPTEVYASGEQGRVLRYNGSTWTTMAPATSGILAGFWATGLNSIVSVGAEAGGSNGIAYRYDGSSWLMQSTGTTRVLTSVWGPAGTDLYATGENGTLLRFNGSSWTAMGSGTTELLWSVTGSPAGRSRAVGAGPARVARRRRSAQWSGEKVAGRAEWGNRCVAQHADRDRSDEVRERGARAVVALGLNVLHCTFVVYV